MTPVSAPYPSPPAPHWVYVLRALLHHPLWDRSVLFLILAAALLVGLETIPPVAEPGRHFLGAADRIILALFSIELLIRLAAYLPQPLRFFRDGWNLFDFIIVALCFLPDSGPWAPILRLARLLRTLRLIAHFPRLQILLLALIKSLPSLGYVAVLLALHFYLYAVLGVYLFRHNDPGHFGDLGLALVTLFRVITLEDWTDLMYSAALGTAAYPAEGVLPVGPVPHAFGLLGYIYFISFVALGAMVIINLLVGVMVSSISESQGEALRLNLGLDGADQQRRQLQESLARIEAELVHLRALAAAQKNQPDAS